jgi:hypothetical protein
MLQEVQRQQWQRCAAQLQQVVVQGLAQLRLAQACRRFVWGRILAG